MQLYKKLYDLKNCEEEPLKYIQVIQPYGELLVVDKVSSKLHFYSEGLLKYFTEEALDDLVRKIIEITSNDENVVFINGLPHYILQHQRDNFIVIEIEPKNDKLRRDIDEDNYQKIVLNLTSATTFDSILEFVVEEIKTLLDYDHVMIYEFDDQYNGEVIKEKKEPSRQSLLGLRFPASDIPKQARDLYFKEKIRIIFDSNSDQNQILRHSKSEFVEGSINLTGVAIRGVSPIHLEYLRNMGVSASFSVAIIRKDKLWGLIACHSIKPKFITFKARKWLVFLAALLETKIQTNSFYVTEYDKERKKGEFAILKHNLTNSLDLISSLLAEEINILSMVGAAGIYIKSGKISEVKGDIPSIEKMQEMVSWLSLQPDFEIMHLNNSKLVLPPALYDPKIAGFIAAKLSKISNDYIIWTNPEMIEEVTWVENPNKSKVFDEDNQRISPRKSFELWKSLESHRAKVWTLDQIDTAGRIRNEIKEYLYLKYNELQLLNLELTKAYEDLESFSYTVSHDLKAPLRSIDGFAQIIKEDYGHLLDVHGIELIDVISNSVQKMNIFIKDIMSFSKLQNKKIEIAEVDTKQLVESVWIEERSFTGNDQAILTIIDPLPIVYGDHSLIKQIFSNLFSNSLKYTDQGVVPKIILTNYRDDHYVYFQIQDNGIGIPANKAYKVFEVFSRLVNNKEYEGSGIGLSIVKKVVDRHGGTIYVDQNVTEGTKIHFSLPAEQTFKDVVFRKT